VLAVNNLEVVYDDVMLVLRGVSLTVPPGRIVALLGANGAGKTTLLRALSGLLDVHEGEVTKGSVTFEGKPIHHLGPTRIAALGIKQVLEGRRILGELTVEENLRIGAHVAPRTLRQNMERVFGMFPVLADRRRRTAGYLSGGEQQMLAMGRALMARPTILLLDEPSMGLSPILTEQIFNIIAEINGQGTTVLLVEQNALMALNAAHRGYVIQTGKILLADTAANLAANPQVRQAYLGEI